MDENIPESLQDAIETPMSEAELPKVYERTLAESNCWAILEATESTLLEQTITFPLNDNRTITIGRYE